MFEDEGTTFKKFFYPTPYVGFLNNLVGERLAGIGRGVIWKQGRTADLIAAHI